LGHENSGIVANSILQLLYIEYKNSGIVAILTLFPTNLHGTHKLRGIVASLTLPAIT
jgi:hypothetical protein